MDKIQDFLTRAKDEGILTAGQHEQLNRFWESEQAQNKPNEDGVFGDLSEPVYSDDAQMHEPSEAPRLIRGFHDILISIGIIAALSGLWVLGSALAVIPAILVLAEYFVKRQHLALPAFVLTVMTVSSVSVLINAMMGGSQWDGLIVFFALVAALALFYWRYRVPVALASLIASGFGVVFFLVLAAFGGNPQTVLSDQPRLIGAVGLALGIGLFAIAMRFDLRDPGRVTRRSDVAFWLHLATAPMLLYAAFLVLFGKDGFWWGDAPQISDAVIAIALLTIMVLIGIVIDRRAFVTSGLLSLGAALGILTQESGIEFSSITAFVFLAVGVIVLLLGAGWQNLRGLIVTRLPDVWRANLPPVGG